MLNKIVLITIYLFSFLFPLFYLHLTPESYEYNKMMLLIFTTTLLFFLFILKTIRRRKIILYRNSFTTVFFFLTAIVTISTLFQSPNLVIALTTPLSTATIIFGFIFYFLLINNVLDLGSNSRIGSDLRGIKGLTLLDFIIFSTILLSLFVMAIYTGIIPKSTLTPAGNLLATTMFLAIISIYLLSKIIIYLLISRQTRFVYLAQTGFVQYLLSLLVIGGTTFFLTIRLLTDQTPIILPFAFGWQIFLDVIKNAKTLALGVGPANFITAFTLAKPVSINMSPVWNVIFTSSSSFLLNLATETGIISAFLYLLIFLKSLKLPLDAALGRLKSGDACLLSLIFALIIQAILPGSMTVFILTIILLAFSSQVYPFFTWDISKLGFVKYVFLIPAIIIFSVVIYFQGRAYLAEIAFKESLDALVNKNGTDAYNLQLISLRLNPFLDRYHTAFSKTNLMVASSLATKQQLTEEDKQNIPRLVQQSIDYAKSGVNLNRTNVVTWDNLVQTYAALINFAKGAEEWTIESYKQKVSLDQFNPQNHLGFGMLYFNLKKYEEAEKELRQATLLKPDLAIAHYQLSHVLKEEKKYQEAYLELQITSSLLNSGSDDAQKVNQELLELSKLIPKGKTATPSSQIKTQNRKNQSLETVESSKSPFKNLPTSIPPLSLPEPQITP